MKTRTTLALITTALLSLAGSSFADDKAATPDQAFLAFRDAFAAKDEAKVLSLVTGSAEDLGHLKEELARTPPEMVSVIKASTVADTHVEGDVAVCLVAMTTPDKQINYRPMFLLLKDGKWLLAKSPDALPKEKVPTLQKWAEDRRDALKK